MSSRARPRVPSRARRASALCLCCLALLAAPHSAAPQQATAPEELVLTVTVTDAYGRHVAGLGRESFGVTDGKEAREVTSFSAAGDEPLSVGLVFDVSGSMREFLPAMREAAARLVAGSGTSNEYFVGESGGPGGLRVLADWTRDRAAVTDAFARLATANSKDGRPRAAGVTAWQDACADALGKLSRARTRRRALVLLGDAGHDTGSRTGGDALRRMARESDALFYAVAATDRAGAGAFPEGRTALADLARVTGGFVFFPETQAQLDDVVERLALEFSQQYLVGFAPANAAGAGKLNKVRVKVSKPPTFKGSLHVRAREGYFTRER